MLKSPVRTGRHLLVCPIIYLISWGIDNIPFDWNGHYGPQFDDASLIIEY